MRRLSEPCEGCVWFIWSKEWSFPKWIYNPIKIGINMDSIIDVFLCLKKWIGNPLIPEISKWSSRELEILRWSIYIGDLVVWSLQASLEFNSENEQAYRWPTALQWQELSPVQRARSRRLITILKVVFNGHPDCDEN